MLFLHRNTVALTTKFTVKFVKYTASHRYLRTHYIIISPCVFSPPLFTWDMYTRPTLIQLIEANLLEDISSPHRPHEGLNVYSVTQVSPHWCVILVWLIFPAASLYCLSGVVATCPAGEGVTDVFHIRNVIKNGKYWSSFSGFTAATTFQAGTYSWNTQLKWKRLTTFCHEEDMKRFLCLEHVFFMCMDTDMIYRVAQPLGLRVKWYFST